jgi:hypothetical protein
MRAASPAGRQLPQGLQAVIAAEIKVLGANVFTEVLDSVFSDFERSSGHKVLFECVTAGKVRDRA